MLNASSPFLFLKQLSTISIGSIRQKRNGRENLDRPFLVDSGNHRMRPAHRHEPRDS